MATTYPTDIDNNLSLPKVTDNVSPVRARDVNQLQEAIVAIQVELGQNPSGTSGTVKDRINDIYDGYWTEVTDGLVPNDLSQSLFVGISNGLGKLHVKSTNASGDGYALILENADSEILFGVRNDGSIDISHTDSAMRGVLSKNGTPFLHDFSHPTGASAIPIGRNVFLGEAGNFVMGQGATITSHGSENIGVGYNALSGVTFGYSNVAIGANSQLGLTTGIFNVGIGTSTLASNTGSTNVALGHASLGSKVGGSGNVALGFNSGRYIIGGGSNVTSDNSVFLGTGARASNTGETNQIVMGTDAEGNGSNTITFGNDSVITNHFTGNLIIPKTISSGTGVILKDTGVIMLHDFSHPTGDTAIPSGANVFLGGAGNFTMGSTATSISHASLNIGIGSGALSSNTVGSQNIAIGLQSMTLNQGGAQNVAIGSQSLLSNTSGYFNVAIGAGSMFSNVGGFQNLGIGTGALYQNLSGSSNVVIGINAMRDNETGSSNVAAGLDALRANIGGSQNFGLGASSLRLNTTGSNNIAVGPGALGQNISTDYNIGLGFQAGHFLGDGSTANTASVNCIYIGRGTRSFADSTNNEIALGYFSTGNGSNTVTIGDSTITDNYFFGDLHIEGSVQVGDNVDAASATNVGSTRYRTTANDSFFEVSMQTGVGTYAWIQLSNQTW